MSEEKSSEKTAFDDGATGPSAIKEGADEYLVKGQVTGERLKQLIQQVVEKGQAK